MRCHCIPLIAKLLFAFPILFFPVSAESQASSSDGKAMMILDASGSMWGQIDGVAKIRIARDVIDSVLEEWDPGVDIGLMAYGHRRKGDCGDIEIVQPIAPLNADGFSDLVRSLSPRGKTPITESLFLAAKELRHIEDPASVILVSDGLETCEADPCIMAALLEESGIDFTIHVVGFGLTDEEARQLQCIAENTGGKFLSADNATELTSALSQTVEAVSANATASPAVVEPPFVEEVPKFDVPTRIAGLDLNGLSFIVDELYEDAASGRTIAKGTSNGVGWTVTANSIYAPLTNQDGRATFNDLPGAYDDLHVGSDFVVTFERPVTSLLVVLANDNNTGDGPNFQELAPVDFVDASTPNGGTQVRIDDRRGALFYYLDIEILTLTHVNDNGINDGWDLAFFAFPAAD